MAPKYFRYKVFTYKGEIWSFGVLLWEMYAFGSNPYPAVANKDIVKKMVFEWRNHMVG